MADYRDHYNAIRAAGASVVAVSVDGPAKSETLRRDLQLPFSILCDTDKRVIREWGVYNPDAKDGIAKPSVFILNNDRVVRFAAVDEVTKRVSAEEVLRILQTGAAPPSFRRKTYIPRLRDLWTAIRAK